MLCSLAFDNVLNAPETSDEIRKATKRLLLSAIEDFFFQKKKHLLSFSGGKICLLSNRFLIT